MASDLSSVIVGSTNDSSEEDAFNRQALNVEERNPELKKDIARCETPLALPPHNIELPEDVLRIIFDLICQIEPFLDVEFCHYPALALSYVCSAWRRTILDMPHIWAQFPLRIKLVNKPTQHRAVSYRSFKRLRLFHILLTRGGSLPRRELSIGYNGLCSDLVEQVVAPFTFHILGLALKFDEMHSLKKIPPEHMLHWHRLCIGCHDCQSFGPYLPAGTLCLPPQLPCLVDLTLCRTFGEHLEKLITAVPWHNLKELFLEFDIPATTCLNVILRQGMSLVSCALRPTSDAMFSSLPHTEPPVVLPRMGILALHCSSHADVATFKRLLSMPAASTQYIGTSAHYGRGAYLPVLTPFAPAGASN